MLKSIILMSIFSIFISNAMYVQSAEAGFLEDAVKEKLRKKLRKELKRNSKYKKHKKKHHRKNYTLEAVIQKMENVKYRCSGNFTTWKREYKCFNRGTKNIKKSISLNIKSISSIMGYGVQRRKILSNLHYALDDINEAREICQRKRNWKRATLCYDNRLTATIDNTKLYRLDRYDRY